MGACLALTCTCAVLRKIVVDTGKELANKRRDAIASLYHFVYIYTRKFISFVFVCFIFHPSSCHKPFNRSRLFRVVTFDLLFMPSQLYSFVLKNCLLRQVFLCYFTLQLVFLTDNRSWMRLLWYLRDKKKLLTKPFSCISCHVSLVCFFLLLLHIHIHDYFTYCMY